jgi:hypothetical protein
MEADSTIGMSLMRQPDGDRLIVNLVNYDIDLDGRIREKKDVQVSVRVPEGKTLKSTTVLSPDRSGGARAVAFSIAASGKHRYASVTVPSLLIYDLIVFDW